LGQRAFGRDEFGLGGGDCFAGRNAGRVLDLRGVGADVHGVVGEGVDPVVRGGVLEHVLDPPAGPQPAQQGRAGGVCVAGQDL